MEGADGERTEEELVAQGRSFPSFFFFLILSHLEKGQEQTNGR